MLVIKDPCSRACRRGDGVNRMGLRSHLLLVEFGHYLITRAIHVDGAASHHHEPIQLTQYAGAMGDDEDGRSCRFKLLNRYSQCPLTHFVEV